MAGVPGAGVAGCGQRVNRAQAGPGPSRTHPHTHTHGLHTRFVRSSSSLVLSACTYRTHSPTSTQPPTQDTPSRLLLTPRSCTAAATPALALARSASGAAALAAAGDGAAARRQRAAAAGRPPPAAHIRAWGRDCGAGALLDTPLMLARAHRVPFPAPLLVACDVPPPALGDDSLTLGT